jgi:acetyltransferase (GNAT) family protein/GNAT acetyltransferase-like protein
MSSPIIRAFEKKDIASLHFLQPEGWNDIAPVFEFYLKNNACFPFAAVRNNRLVGIACAILNPKTGWLGHIIVSDSQKRKGTGSQLTRHGMGFLHKKKCCSISLIATDVGQLLYQALDFRDDGTYLHFQGKKLEPVACVEEIRKIEAGDRGEILALDRFITGEERGRVLNDYLSEGWLATEPTTGKISGFYLSEFGEGTIIAEIPDAGLELLKLKHSMKDCRSTIPANNKPGREWLETEGFEIITESTRMIHGDKVHYKPDCIFSRIGGCYA